MNFSGWLKMKTSGELCTEKHSGELKMKNYSIRP